MEPVGVEMSPLRGAFGACAAGVRPGQGNEILRFIERRQQALQDLHGHGGRRRRVAGEDGLDGRLHVDPVQLPGARQGDPHAVQKEDGDERDDEQPRRVPPGGFVGLEGPVPDADGVVVIGQEKLAQRPRGIPWW